MSISSAYARVHTSISTTTMQSQDMYDLQGNVQCTSRQDVMFRCRPCNHPNHSKEGVSSSSRKRESGDGRTEIGAMNEPSYFLSQETPSTPNLTSTRGRCTLFRRNHATRQHNAHEKTRALPGIKAHPAPLVPDAFWKPCPLSFLFCCTSSLHRVGRGTSRM